MQFHLAPGITILSATLLTTAICTRTLGAQLGVKFTNGGTPTTQVYLEAKYSKTLIPQTGLTLEAWITYDETTLGTGYRWPTIARMNNVGGKEAYWLRVQAGQNKNRVLAFGVRTSVGFRTANYSFAAGEFKNFTHVAAVHDGKAVMLYINGVRKASTAAGPNLIDNGGLFRLGNGYLPSAREAWNGDLDEVRLWPVARTAGEIKSTMNFALRSVPGVVSTWGLDFSPKDTSGGNSCVDVNKPAYGVNNLRLTGVPLGGADFGKATVGCNNNTPAAGITAHAKAGNPDFALTCIGAARQTGGRGFVWVGFGRLTTPFRLDGADIWIDPTKVGVLVGVVGDNNGLCRLPVAIPSSAPKNATLYCQFFWNQTGCNVPLFASAGLTITIQ